MSRLTKNLLVLALVALAAGVVFNTGLIRVGDRATLLIALPVGAVLFGLYMISRLLEKEAALYDEQQRAAVRACPAHGAAVKPCCRQPSQPQNS